MNILLAAATEVAEKGGFGFNLNLFSTNFINLAILVGGLVYFGSKTLNDILTQRRSKIAQAIKEAEENQKKSLAALAQSQEKMQLVQSEIQQILKSAETQSKIVALEIANQADKEIERLQESAVKDLGNEEQRVLTQLRQRIARLAVEKAEVHLKQNIDANSQEALLERSIAQLGG